VGKLTVSHRYNHLSLLPSNPGEFQQELVAQDLPGCKSRKICITTKEKVISLFFLILSEILIRNQLLKTTGFQQ
jgi:hypothetical protein